MDPQLKQRLVGIAVIFSVAVIFLPMILDGSGQPREKLEIDIPPRPDMSQAIDAEQKVLEIQREVAELPEMKPIIVDEISRDNESQADSTTKDSESAKNVTPRVAEQEKITKAEASKPPPNKAITPAPRPKPKTKPQVGGESWVIQVGSFSEQQRAFNQRDKLRKSKLAAVFIERFEPETGKNSYRVRMGPFLDKKSATVVRNKIMAKYEIRGLVMKYER